MNCDRCGGKADRETRLVLCLSCTREVRRSFAEHCDTCTFQGVGNHPARGGRYKKCLNHSLPCDELGNRCGKWTLVAGETGGEGHD